MLSIFTPTYNRKQLLPRLYNSLQAQISREFEWIIVDDGSSDDTDILIREYANAADFSILYYYQKNSGKHVAFNEAIKLASGEIIICIDSDDYLAQDTSVSEILADWNCVKDEKNCAGIISLKSLANGKLLGSEIPENMKFASPFDLSHIYHLQGERNIIFRLAYLKEYMFPEYEGEKFCPDSYISDKMSQKYTMYLRHKVDVICEYQDDGLSYKFKQLMKEYPKGFCISNMQMIDMEPSFRSMSMTAIRYWAFRFLAGNCNINYDGTKHKIWVKVCSVPGFALYIYYRFRLYQK